MHTQFSVETVPIINDTHIDIILYKCSHTHTSTQKYRYKKKRIGRLKKSRRRVQEVFREVLTYKMLTIIIKKERQKPKSILEDGTCLKILKERKKNSTI